MLLGRDRERHELDRVLAEARSGHSGVLALVGEPGIGKSALLDAAAGGAEGMRILRARGIESEAQVPFAGLLELLRPALSDVDRIPAPQAAALERALALRPGGAQDRFAVGAATLSLLAAYADAAPLLVLVDDVHWLDGSSAEALLFAVRRLVADPIAVVLAVREDEPSLLDGSGLTQLRLEGLDPAAAAELIGAPADVAERLYRATAGNPLALLELAPDAGEVAAAPLEAPLPISATVAKAFLRRSASLSDHARRGLVLAAASDSGDLTVLARAGLRVDDLAEAESVGLIRLAGGRLEFRHPLARSAVYGEAAPEERRAAHRALADALPDRDVDRRAWHLASAATGPDPAAAAALEQAALRARGRSAYSVSATGFERAAQLEAEDARRGQLLLEAAESAWLAGQAERARTLLDESALFAADPHIDYLRGDIAVRRGPVMEGYALLVAAAERAEPEAAVLMLAEAGDACFYAGAVAEMLATAERANALVAAGAEGRAPFYAAIADGASRVIAGIDGGPDAFRRALELFAAGEFGDDPRVLAWAAVAPMFLRDAEGGRDLIDRAIAAAREHTAIGVLPRLLSRLARDGAMTDRWAGAQVEYHEAIRLARETGQRTELAAALAGLAWFEGRQGKESECREHAAEGRTLCVELGIGFYEIWSYAALGELELGLGRPAAAVEHFEEQEERAQELGFADVDMSPGAELVDAYLRLGRADDAARAAHEYAVRARAKGFPWALARAERCLGLVDADYEPHFAEALRLHEQTLDVFETARTRLAYGALLRRARQRVRAREHLRAALEAFERLGPSPWADAAGAELAATGETARRRDPSTLDELTPQELQIALLLASGRTTREAAAALFLSPKTIEYHLRHVYRKLGIGSRDELSERLAGPPS